MLPPAPIEETAADFACRLRELMALHEATVAALKMRIAQLESENSALMFRKQLLESLRAQ